MKKFILLSLVATALSIGSMSAVKQNSVKREERDARIIVQLNDSADELTESALINKQNSVLRTIRTYVTDNFNVCDRFTNVFNGFTLDVPSSYVTKIRSIPGIQRINYNKMIYQTTNDEMVSLNVKKAVNIKEETANVSKESMQIPDGTSEGEGVLIGILDTGGYIYYDEQGQKVQHDIYTELEAGTKLKIADEAALKALEDSSATFHGKYDSSHSTYWNNKVPFYYDYGGDTTVRNTIGKEDYDVFSKAQEHGTHVASIAAGNSPYYKGIAPKAQIAVMKVFTCYNPTSLDAEEGYTASAGAYADALLKALEDCAILGVDVINMSLGSNLNDFDNDSIVQRVITNLKNNGVYVNHAAGNDGKNTFNNSAYEYWTTDNVETGILSSYSNNPSTVEVAASQADKEYYETAFIVGNSTVSFKDQIESYTSSDGDVVYDPEHHLTDLIKDGSHPDGVFQWMKVPGLGDEKDYEGLADDCLENKIAIIDRGEVTFVDKIKNARKRGAIAVGIIDNDPSNTDFTVRMALSGYNPGCPVIFILFRDKAVFDNATEFTAKIVENETVNNPGARTMTTFSSNGATFDLQLKPDIATPGQNILGAVNEETDSYEYYDGTSMATPNYCGVMALMIGDHLEDQDYRGTINARLMSTAEPMKDSRNMAEKAFASVRKQGAGLVNGGAAMNSKLYLDGSTSDNLSNYAKIALGNNEKIKNGNLALSFSIINESNAPVNYKATTYIYRPELVTLDEERFPEFAGTKFQSTDNYLIDKVENNITANVGQTVINLPEYQLSNEAKAEIDENFPNGTFIEGFVVLEADDQYQLSIPYLGFYGDYASGEPVEPFKFEKEEGKVYGSDLVNSLVHNWKGLEHADLASDWVIGNFDSFSDVVVDDALLNEKTFRDLVDGNTNLLVPATTNPYTGKTETKDIYVGNNGFANTMIITQFVMRSVATNTITLTNKATNEVVLTDHMFDDLFGAKEDDDGNEIAWPLYKSQVDTSYWSSGLIAHRAYTLIPLYSMDSGHNKLAEFPEGEYEMKFNYTLAAGGTFEKTYTIHIDSKAPSIKSMEVVNHDGVDYVHVRYNEDNMSYFDHALGLTEAKKDEKGYYLEFPLADAGDGFFIKATDYSFASTRSIVGKVGDLFMSVTSSKFLLTHRFEATVTDNSADNKTVSIAFKKSGTATTIAGDLEICMQLFPGMDPKYVRVYEVSSKSEKLVKSEINDGYVSFTISTKKFRIDASEYTPVESVSLDQTTLEIEVGQTATLHATVLPAAANQEISWDSSDKSVVRVDAKGVVTARKAGTAVVTASSPEFKYATCTVTVTPVPVTLSSIDVKGAKSSFYVGDQFSSEGLVVTATYSDKSTKDVTNEATVDSSAVNMAVAGSYTVKVTFESKEASYTISVLAIPDSSSSSSEPTSSSSASSSSSSSSSSIPSSSSESSSVIPSSSSEPSSSVAPSSSSESASSSESGKSSNGCGGSVVSSLAIVGLASIVGVLATVLKKKEK